MADGFAEPSGGSGAGGAYIATDDAGFDNFFEKTRQSLVALGHAQFSLGGSRTQSHVPQAWQEVIDYEPFIVRAAKEGGALQWEARVELITEAAGTSITARIRNITDATTAVTGAAVTATSWTAQTLSFTPTVGKIYHLQAQRSNDSYFCWVKGVIERTAP